jgi:cytochrome c oxidase subunit 3
VDKEGNRVALAEFATTLPEERQLTRNKVNGFMDEPSFLYSVAEVQAGFKGASEL